MIILNGKYIKDPSLLTEQETASLRDVLFLKYPKVYIPEHITLNKEKSEYKVGYLNELFSKVFPEVLKKDIFKAVMERFDIFVEKRQYFNLINEYGLKKYSVFIKN
jgi:hypothetical protein